MKSGRQWLAGLFGSLAAFGCGRGDSGHAQASPAASQGREAHRGPRCHAGWPMPNLASSGLPNRESYDTSSADVVLDRVTGLTWQRTVDRTAYDARRASSYCETLTLAGHSDWRLPSIIELASISDTSRSAPAADPVAFPNTPPEKFWSSQRDVTNTGLGWFAFLKTGGVYVGDDIIRTAHARCVRGPSSCGDPDVSAYSVADDTARDTKTGLTWQRVVEHDNYTWKDAIARCSSLGSNSGGWRLPSLRELLTLVDVTHAEAAIDATAFPNTPSEFFWSSSSSTSPAGAAWGVNFTRGSSGEALVSTKAHVRCTR